MMEYYCFKKQDFIKARDTVEDMQKLLKQRNMAVINHKLLLLGDIFLNVSVISKEK